MLARTIDLFCGGDAARYRRLGDWLDASEQPAAVSGVDGRLRRVNAAMQTNLGPGTGGIASYLTAGYEVDPALIYRLTTAARKMGVAFAPVAGRADRDRRVLAVRSHEPGLLVWSLLRMEDMGECVPENAAEASGAAGMPPDPVGAKASPAALPPGAGPDSPLSARIEPQGATEAERGGTSGRGTAALAQSTLESMPVALMQLDLDGRLVWCNGLGREMMGCRIVPGSALADVVEPLGRPIAALIAEASTDPRGRREMVRLRSAANETFLHIVLTPARFGDCSALLAVLSDASEIRSLEDKFAQSQKMEAIGKLAGGVAHDFNNVLTAISGHSDLLLLGKDALHPDYSDLMQIRQNTHRAAALVRQLLAFSRKQTLTPKLLSVQDVVSDSLYLLNRLIGEKVSLTVEHGADTGYIRADQQQFEQALMNLVVNARDAMPNGGVVTIATQALTIGADDPIQGIEVPAGTYVEISVSDNGTGIDPHIIDRVFEPFFTTKPQGEGTGLGLPTVYGIVKQSGGFVFAENRPEGGARFRILLPNAPATPAERAMAEPAAETERPDLTGRGTVLLVEDEDPVRSFASRALRLRGYAVLEAASAEDALEILNGTEAQIDVLVSDVVMPGMDGPTFAVQARRMRPGLRVVFVSGYAEDSFRRNLIDHDFDFLPKPFSLTELTAKVKEALRRHG